MLTISRSSLEYETSCKCGYPRGDSINRCKCHSREEEEGNAQRICLYSCSIGVQCGFGYLNALGDGSSDDGSGEGEHEHDRKERERSSACIDGGYGNLRNVGDEGTGCGN